MADHPKDIRRRRSRRTQPILSNRAGGDRWWQAEPLGTMAVRKTLRFRDADPFERIWWLRSFVVAMSLTTPVLLVLGLYHSQIRSRLMDWTASPVEQAQHYLERGRTTDALAALQQACDRSPNNPELLRALATLGAETAPADARRCFHRLEKLDLATAEDRAAHASLLARLHDFSGARAVLANLPNDSQETPTVLRARLAICRESGDFYAAADALDKLTAVVPDDVDTSLDLAAAIPGGTLTAGVVERIETQLVTCLSHWIDMGRGSAVLDRAPRLVGLTLTSKTGRTQLAKILRSLPGDPVEYRMAAVRLEFPAALSLEDDQMLHRAYLAEITRSGGLPAEDKDRVAAYLQDQGEHEFVIEMIAQPEALTEPQLFRRRLASLLELGRWRETGAMAAADDAPPVTHSRAMLRALAVLQGGAGQGIMAEHLLLDALSCAREERRAVDCYTTGCAALDNYLPDLASNAFASALEFAADRRTAMESIIRTTRGKGLSAATLLRSLEGGAVLRDESIQDKLIYLSLLAERQVDAMKELIQSRRSKAQGDVYLRFLESFALHQQGAYVQASQLLVPLPKYQWHQGEAAVIASIMASAGKLESCSSLVAQIDSSRIFKEEKALVEPWQVRMLAETPLLSNAGTHSQR
ncbi:MAG: hypothetical protein KDK97_03490 [Verrucomicrobiales bacterium]|nr:hypothetical protein [Verrucomicrobiales bacterium]MCP5557197.1 hypothetical protein [Verrucomicrobiaceae bacterium]